MTPLNPDGSEVRLEAAPRGYPPAPGGFWYRSPDPECGDENCSGGCWALYLPESWTREQLGHQLARWAQEVYSRRTVARPDAPWADPAHDVLRDIQAAMRRYSAEGGAAKLPTRYDWPRCAARGCNYPVPSAGRVCGECAAAEE